MFMCCSRASDRCSSRPRGVTFRTTGRSASAGWEARKTRPDAPRPSSASEPEPRQDLADFREGGGAAPGCSMQLAIEQDLQLVPPAREPPRHLGRIDRQAGLQAEAGLLVDQPDGGLVAELGMARQDVLGPGPLAATPGGDQLLDLPRPERSRRAGREREFGRWRNRDPGWPSPCPQRIGLTRGTRPLSTVAASRFARS